MASNQRTKIGSLWQRSLSTHLAWWATGVVLLILVGGGWWLVRPQYLKLSQLRQVAALEETIRTKRTQLEQLRAELVDWESRNRQAAEDLELMLPGTIDLPNLLVEVEALATQAGFRLRSVSVAESSGVGSSRNARPPATSGGVRTLRVTLSLEGGSYLSFKTFLGAVASAWRLVNLDSFSFSGNQSLYSVELTSYYYPR